MSNLRVSDLRSQAENVHRSTPEDSHSALVFMAREEFEGFTLCWFPKHFRPESNKASLILRKKKNWMYLLSLFKDTKIYIVQMISS